MNNIPLHEFAEHVSEYEYVAWVPCIAGRLNYKNAPSKTTLGSLQVPRGLNVKVGVGSNGEQGYRALAVTSTHNWQDTVDNNASGDFKVLVVGRADSYDDHCVMKLKLGLVHVDYESDMREATDAFEALMSAAPESRDEAFVRLEQSLDFNQENIDQLKQGGTLDKGKEKHGEYHLVEALLHPNGLILCRYIDDGFRDPQLKASDSSAYMLQRSTVIRQAYYYFKYVFHQHKHHREADDCACSVLKIPDDARNIGPKLVGTLTSSVNQFRRLLDHVGQCDVHHVGVIGYIASLAKSCKRVGFYDGDSCAYEHQNDRLAYVEQSFTAMVKERAFNRISVFQRRSLNFQLVTLMTVIIGTTLILSKGPGNNFGLVYLGSLFAAYLILVCGKRINRLRQSTNNLLYVPFIKYWFYASRFKRGLITVAIYVVLSGAVLYFINSVMDWLRSLPL